MYMCDGAFFCNPTSTCVCFASVMNKVIYSPIPKEATVAAIYSCMYNKRARGMTVAIAVATAYELYRRSITLSF